MRRGMKKLNLMSQVKLTGVISLLVCLFFLAGAANAALIYDNLYSTNDGMDPVADPVVGYGPLYDSFTVGAGGFNLSDVKLLLQGTPSSGSLSVGLYSDSSTTPGGLLYAIGTLSDNALPVSLSVVDFPLGSPQALTAGRYWLGLRSFDTNDTTALWGWSLDQLALGVPGEYLSSGGEVYSNEGGAYQMQLSDIPLPGAVWLLGSGLVGLVGWRRFRKS